jgi:hypothetical protein
LKEADSKINECNMKRGATGLGNASRNFEKEELNA